MDLGSDVLGFESHPCTVAWLGELNPESVPSIRQGTSIYLVGFFWGLAEDLLSVCGSGPMTAVTPPPPHGGSDPCPVTGQSGVLLAAYSRWGGLGRETERGCLSVVTMC